MKTDQSYFLTIPAMVVQYSRARSTWCSFLLHQVQSGSALTAVVREGCLDCLPPHRAPCSIA